MKKPTGAPANCDERDQVALASDSADRRAEPHLIVGVGASAGGLTAFQSFIRAVPADSGMAFVLIQHLDPDYDSALAEILGECTAMPVIKAVDGTVARPNTVSVIGPNSILKIEGGVLRVARPETVTARRSSIDTFLVSLAEDQGENAVGIILSGFGSDGTVGIAAIKECGGLTLSEAEFDHHAKAGMPQSAVSGGFVDDVLQPQDMPATLLEYQTYKSSIAGRAEAAKDSGDMARSLITICAVLHSRLGRDFGQYKKSTLLRRVRRRMQVLRLETAAAYIERLRSSSDEPELLFREILIGVTRFFRDPAVWEMLAETIIPRLIEGPADQPVRVWVAGCATGEEVYSLAILFKEAAMKMDSPRRIIIFGTDVDDRAVALARAGLYSAAIEADLTVERLEHHFVKEGDRYRIAKHIREMCLFSAHDLVKDPPFSKLDMVSCRNLLIYFETQLQQRVIGTFHYALKPDGVLWLGPSETINFSTRLFEPLHKRSRLFRRLNVDTEIPRPVLRRTRADSSTVPPPAGAGEIDDHAATIMSRYAPAYVILDSKHEIQRFSGPVARFLEPVSGAASLNLFQLLHSELRAPTRALLRKAAASERNVQQKRTLHIGGVPIAVNLIVEPMSPSAGATPYVMLAFQDLELPEPVDESGAGPQDGSHPASQGELLAAREQLQTVTEELETANEELQSSNEEFQSVNEELHSTVEELETSKEELQSINEELQTVNVELNTRAESLVRSNSDLANLFDSTSIATLFLDNDFRIRRFTPAITDIFNVREGDAGRPLSDFSSRLVLGALTQDCRTVLRDLRTIEREVQSDDAVSSFLMRIKPYRDLKNVIDGVVLTFIDITDRKRAERDRAQLAAIVESSEDAIIGHDLDGIVTSWNRGAEKIYGYKADEIIGQPMSTLLGEEQIDEWPANLDRLRQGQAIHNFDISRMSKGDRPIEVSLTISPIRDEGGRIVGASAVARDIAERRAAEAQAALLMAELDHRVKNILSVVSSVVSQTLKSGGPPEAMRLEIDGRIKAIARAHTLLTRGGNAEGALLDLVRTELAPYDHIANITISGDDVVLSSSAGITLGLAIHELATNAAKYGALSVPEGHVDVSWRVSEGNPPLFTLVWRESDGPPVNPPTGRGFGTKLIERSVAHGLGATVKREFRKDGVHLEISAPFVVDIGSLRRS